MVEHGCASLVWGGEPAKEETLLYREFLENGLCTFLQWMKPFYIRGSYFHMNVKLLSSCALCNPECHLIAIKGPRLTLGSFLLFLGFILALVDRLWTEHLVGSLCPGIGAWPIQKLQN